MRSRWFLSRTFRSEVLPCFSLSLRGFIISWSMYLSGSVFLSGVMMRSWAPLCCSLPKSSMRSEWHHFLWECCCVLWWIDASFLTLLCVFCFSSARVMRFCPHSWQMPWCSPSHSLKRGTWKVQDCNAFWELSSFNNEILCSAIIFL